MRLYQINELLCIIKENNGLNEEVFKGIFSKIGQKIGNAMEKSASQNMTGASKELYEKEKLEKEKSAQNVIELPTVDIAYTKDDLKNLDELIIRANLVDDSKMWLAGFSNHRTNQNASAANLFTGKKNLRFLTKNESLFYFAHFHDDHFKSYKTFKQENIRKTEIKTKLLGASTCYIELIDGTVFTIDVTENKEMLSQFKELFKK